MPGAQPADELVDRRRERAAVRDAPFDAFGDELLVGCAALPVAIFRAVLHRAERAHAAIDLVTAALVEHEIAGGFVGAGEERADHDARGARRDRLGDVARVLDATVGDDRDAVAIGGARAVGDGGDLRHADARYDARRADAARARCPTFTASTPASMSASAASAGRDVAGDDLDVRELALGGAHRVDDAATNGRARCR